jgi:Ca2+-binding RTX toxin-like protein
MQRLDLVGVVTGPRFAVPTGAAEIVAAGTSVTILNHVTRETVTRSLAAGGTGADSGLTVHAGGRVPLAVDGVAGSVLPDALDMARAAGGAASVSAYLSGSMLTGVQAVELLAAPVGSATFLIAARPAGQGLAVWRMTDDNRLTGLGTLDDGPALAAANIAALCAVTAGGATYVVAGSASEHGVQVWRLSATGGLTAVDRQGPAEGVPIAGVSALRSVTAGGESFVIAAAAGSSSLTAFRVGTDGRLTATDQVIDDLNTRFDAVTALDAITVDGRVFVVAAGADSGISLFTLCPKGRFVHLSTLADTAAMGLAGISAVEMVRVGGEVQVIVASGAEAGLTVLRLNLAGIGAVVAATGASTTGGNGADLMWRSSGSGTIEGGAGDDILIDGAGSDALRGGSGADVFVLWDDGARDTILDFDPAQDRIDLSQWRFLRSTTQIEVTPTATGAVLRFGGEVLEIRTAAGTPLTAAQVQALALVPVTRVHLDDPPAGGEVVQGGAAAETLAGGDGDDTLRGEGGSDTLAGGAGADALFGGAGWDWASYRDATAPVRIDLADPSRNGGAAAGDSLDGIEGIEGSAGADTMTGGAVAMRLIGRDGDDRIAAGAAADTLEGNGGNDTLAGGAGANRLLGGDGNDSAEGGGGADKVYGGDGHDTLAGGEGSDRLWGDAGADRLDGGAGPDTLDGGAGDDVLAGGAGPDLLAGGEGFDLASYAAADAAVSIDLSGGTAGGAAVGDVLQGIEVIEGSAFADTLAGDVHDNALWGLAGDDLLLGGDGADTLDGAAGDDTLKGGAGDDRVTGGDGNDRVGGKRGNDTVDVGAGDDRVRSGAGDDRITAGDGADDIRAGGDHDHVWGGTGDDVLAGGSGRDRLSGDGGQDRLDGGTGDDTLWGGGGSDVFVFGRLTAGEEDVVADFADGHDRLALLRVGGATDAARLAALEIAAAVRDGVAGVTVTHEGHVIFLPGIGLAQIGAADFLWS